MKIDHEFDKNIKPLKKAITKKKKVKEINKMLKSKVKLLTDTPAKDDIFKKDLWSNYRSKYRNI